MNIKGITLKVNVDTTEIDKVVEALKLLREYGLLTEKELLKIVDRLPNFVSAHVSVN